MAINWKALRGTLWGVWSKIPSYSPPQEDKPTAHEAVAPENHHKQEHPQTLIPTEKRQRRAATANREVSFERLVKKLEHHFSEYNNYQRNDKSQLVQIPSLNVNDKPELQEPVDCSFAEPNNLEDKPAILAESTTKDPFDLSLRENTDTELVPVQDEKETPIIIAESNELERTFASIERNAPQPSDSPSEEDIDAKLTNPQDVKKATKVIKRVAFPLPQRIVSFPDPSLLPKEKEIECSTKTTSCPLNSFPQCSTRLRKPLRDWARSRDGKRKVISPKIKIVGTEQIHIWEDFSDNRSEMSLDSTDNGSGEGTITPSPVDYVGNNNGSEMSLDSTDDGPGEKKIVPSCPDVLDSDNGSATTLDSTDNGLDDDKIPAASTEGPAVVNIPNPELSEITRDEFDAITRKRSTAVSDTVRCMEKTRYEHKTSRGSDFSATDSRQSESSKTARTEPKASRKRGPSPVYKSHHEHLEIAPYDLGIDLLGAYSSSQRERVMYDRHKWSMRWLAENGGYIPKLSPTHLTRDDREYHRLRQLAEEEPENRRFYNAEAARRIYTLNNHSRTGAEIDLHMLRVWEAVLCFRLYVFRVWEIPEKSRWDLVTVIVGRGTHSLGGIPRLPGAIAVVCREMGLIYYPMDGHMVVKLIREHRYGHGGRASMSEMLAGCSQNSIRSNASRLY